MDPILVTNVFAVVGTLVAGTALGWWTTSRFARRRHLAEQARQCLISAGLAALAAKGMEEGRPGVAYDLAYRLATINYLGWQAALQALSENERHRVRRGMEPMLSAVDGWEQRPLFPEDWAGRSSAPVGGAVAFPTAPSGDKPAA